MTRPSTMVVRPMDDERTLVDPRCPAEDLSAERTLLLAELMGSCDADRPFEGSGRAISSSRRGTRPDESAGDVRALCQLVRAQVSIRGRRILVAGLLLAAICGLALTAYQQSRVASALRKAIDEMSASESARPFPDGLTSAVRSSAPSHAPPNLDSTTADVGGGDRDALEARGASLIGSNNFSNALTHYRMLTRLFPGEAVFQDVVTVLQRKLSCTSPADPASSSCP
jgi:hypothetical protein